MKYPRILLPIILVLTSNCLLHAQNLIQYPQFDDHAANNWGVFLPDESKKSNCQFDVTSDSPHSGTSCARLQSDQYARFSIFPKTKSFFNAKPGERYHIIAWVKAGP